MPVADEPVETIETTESDTEDIQDVGASVPSAITSKLPDESESYNYRIVKSRANRELSPPSSDSTIKAVAF